MEISGKIRVMWLCNTPLPEMYKYIKRKHCKEGWLVGISNELRKQEGIEFYYVFPQKYAKRTIKAEIDHISFWGYYHYTKSDFYYMINSENEERLRKVISQIKPDIIHIFGTELPHTLECVNILSDTGKVVVSIQGLVSELSKYYLDGIPLRNLLIVKKNKDRWDSVLIGKYDFFRRGLNEKKVLKKVGNIIGRTEWDRKCIKKINPKCRYFYCSETLRSAFYDGNWDIDAIERHSIFVSQGDYPIKGLHTLLYALPYVLNRFPDTKVYVAGERTFLEQTAYGKYIKKIIKRQKLKNIVFTGFLHEGDMCDMLQRVHVMVMPSNCENSPNSIGEAMLVGLPVVVSDVGGVSSIAHDGKDALLCKSCDYVALARNICRIFKSDALAKKLSVQGKQTAEQLYNTKNNVDELLSIYNNIYNQYDLNNR